MNYKSLIKRLYEKEVVEYYNFKYSLTYSSRLLTRDFVDYFEHNKPYCDIINNALFNFLERTLTSNIEDLSENENIFYAFLLNILRDAGYINNYTDTDSVLKLLRFKTGYHTTYNPSFVRIRLNFISYLNKILFIRIYTFFVHPDAFIDFLNNYN
nr:MAG: hypothetical protein [Microvirus Sku113]